MPGEAALMPMDGYHFDNAILVERGLLPRKGAPQTFDVDGLARDLERLRAGGREVIVPVFDRKLDLARAGARAIRPEQPGDRRSRATTSSSTSRPGAGSSASSTARSFSQSSGRSCAGGSSPAGCRTASTPKPPAPAPRGTTSPMPTSSTAASARPTSCGGTGREGIEQVTQAVPGRMLPSCPKTERIR